MSWYARQQSLQRNNQHRERSLALHENKLAVEQHLECSRNQRFPSGLQHECGQVYLQLYILPKLAKLESLQKRNPGLFSPIRPCPWLRGYQQRKTTAIPMPSACWTCQLRREAGGKRSSWTLRLWSRPVIEGLMKNSWLPDVSETFQGFLILAKFIPLPTFF